MDREIALNVVIGCLREAVEQFGTGAGAEINADTVIVGQGAVLDSIGVVSLIVDIEQRLEDEHDVSVTLASEKAMSQRNSPFRTAGVLAEHVCSVIAEGQAA
jgi:acyl carrier protein